jgi:hypothetical protein
LILRLVPASKTQENNEKENAGYFLHASPPFGRNLNICLLKKNIERGFLTPCFCLSADRQAETTKTRTEITFISEIS